MKITYNGNEYNAIYNPQSGYYELNLTAPEIGGVYQVVAEYTDIVGDVYSSSTDIQVLVKPKLEIDLNKRFLYIFSYDDFSVKDIIEVADYELNIDEETNAVSTVNILKETTAKARDVIAFKDDNQLLFWGVIDDINNENGGKLYVIRAKYITNLFDRKIQLKNENIIRTTGIEDFLAQTITENYISSPDTFINLSWLELEIKTHTPIQTSVTNVENGIYNLHTWLTNCTQNYNIVYSFSIVNKKLVMTIEKQDTTKELIDTQAQAISNYSEVFETDVTSKVVVLYNKKNDTENPGSYTLYLLNNRTTTTNMNNENRADGRIETVFTENYEDANQTALDTMKSNAYNHNITFSLYQRYIPIGTPISIKTKKSIIYDTYISSIKITQRKFIEYQCGNIRVNFIEKIKKERK